MQQQKRPNQDLSDVLEKFGLNLKRDINCIKIGTVQGFDKDNQTATVEIAVSRLVSENTDGTKVVRRFPLLLEVPCFVLSGGGSFIEMPISKGDSCILLFSDEDLDGWITNNESTPETARRHDLSDALCLVGLNNLPGALSFDGDGIKIRFSDTVYLKLGSSGLEVVGIIDLPAAPGGITVGGTPGVTTTSSLTSLITFVNGIATVVTP